MWLEYSFPLDFVLIINRYLTNRNYKIEMNESPELYLWLEQIKKQNISNVIGQQ